MDYRNTTILLPANYIPGSDVYLSGTQQRTDGIEAMNAWWSEIAEKRCHAVRQLAEQAYYLTIAYYRNYRERRLGAELNGDIILLTMGKVGSMTLLNSLRATIPIHKMRVDKAHCISKKGVAYYKRIFDAGYADWSELPRKTKMLISRRNIQARQLRKGLGKGQRYKIVIIVRDPIATNISGFFHNYLWWPKELQQKCRGGAHLCMDELKLQFLENYPHDIPLTWFDMELTANFNIDFFADKFPNSKGYKIYQGNLVDVLILKLENLNACVGEAFNEFLGLDNFQLLNKNEAKDKWYHQAYREFKDSVELPDNYINRMYDSKWYQHFYSNEELEKFRVKWGSR